MSGQETTKRRLVHAILKFLDNEIQAESLDAERRESIEGIVSCRSMIDCYFNSLISLVAMQCLETAYEVSLSNPQQSPPDGPVIDLLTLVSDATTINTTTTTFSSWFDANDQLVNSILVLEID